MKRLLVISTALLILASILFVVRLEYVSRNIKDARATVLSSQPIVAVVPHHDVVKKRRQELFRQLSLTSQPETIILISPNHFEVGRKSVITARSAWQLRGGAEHMDTDTVIIDQLIKNGDLVEDNPLGVQGDHGITNLLGDIHEFFPKSRLVPILLRDTITPIQEGELLHALADVCSRRCGVIASVDMSHYQTARAADMHDIKTMRALESLDDESIWNVEVDSQASLAFLIEWAKHLSLSHFTLFDHTNSGELTGNFEYETTSHILGYYDSGESEKRDLRVTFGIAGGISSCETNKLSGELLSDFGSRALWGIDLPFAFWSTDSKSLSLRDRLVRGWHWPQLPMSVSATSVDSISVQREVIGDVHVVLVSANENHIALETVIQYEKSTREFVIVLPRWKGDYQFTHSEEQQRKAVSWIRAGASLIVGFHEGGLQDIEIVGGVPVFYSVGGFLEECGTTNSLVINGMIDKETLHLIFDPVQTEGFDARILSGKDRLDVLQHVCSSEIPQCLGGYMESSEAL